MARRVFDTSVLIREWRRRGGLSAARRERVESWAENLVRLYSTNAIVSPVYLEFVAGVTNGDELQFARRFLSQFQVIDRWSVTTEDLRESKRLAERIPRDGRRRQLGDCLIAAMAKRFSRDVISFDEGFPG